MLHFVWMDRVKNTCITGLVKLKVAKVKILDREQWKDFTRGVCGDVHVPSMDLAGLWQATVKEPTPL